VTFADLIAGYLIALVALLVLVRWWRG